MNIAAPIHEPWDIQVEQNLLGACLQDNAHIDTISADLMPEDYHDPFHRRLFSTIQALRATSAVNVLTLAAAMKTDAGYLDTGGDNYLDALRYACPAFPPVKDYIAIIKDLSVRRRLIAIGEELSAGAYTPPSEMPSQSLSGAAVEALLVLGQSASRSAEKPYNVAARVLERAEKHLQGFKPDFVTTGFKKLDGAMGGLQATDFMALCGRSGAGKSAILRSICLSAARTGKPVLFFSKEMSSDQLVQTMLADIDFELKDSHDQPIETWKFRAGCLSNFEINRLTRAQKILDGLPLEIVDDADLTMSGITNRSRAFESRYRGELGLIAVDFLQLVDDDTKGKNDSREQSVTKLSYSHKRLAKYLGWAVAAAVQLKNKGDGKTPSDKMPTGEDIRESGGVEMSADCAFAVHRKAFFHKLKEPANRTSDDWRDWNIEMRAIQHEVLLRGFKNRHGDPAALNIELWGNLAVGAIRDERPGRYHMGSGD